MKPTLQARQLLAALLFFISLSSFAQLANFTLTVTPTAQTCLGNGSLAFSVSGATAGSSITYAVYLLPNTTTPITTTSATTVNSLAAGNYMVIATQALNNQSNTATTNATIANNVVNLQYTLVPGNVTCNNNGTITVNVTAGTAVSYEITAGPVTKPLQTSNVFTGLPVGLYQVRVYDNCGEAVVVSVTLLQVNSLINIGAVAFAGGELPTCTTIMVSNNYSAPGGIGINYPVTLQYTVYPPGGGSPTTVTQTVTSGTNEMTAVTIIPFYYNQPYYYNLTITDACGNVFTRNNNVVSQKLSIAALTEYPGCDGMYFTLVPTNYGAPYTITFTSAPAGFDPEVFNSAQPTFTTGSAQYGSDTQAVPEGTYSVSVLDACGHTATYTFTMETPEYEPSANTSADCGDTVGTISITIPSRPIAAITLLAAPVAYTGPVPADLSAYVNEFGGFEFIDVPLGDYSFFITDVCGDTYTLPVSLQPTSGSEGVTVISRAGCDEGSGSVRIYGSGDTFFETATIVEAPAAFNQPLPYVVSQNINQTGNTEGEFYMNSLPEGDYSITFVDQCGFTQTQPFSVTGYHVTTSEVTIIPHCGTFDIDLQYYSTGSYSQSFWLQKYDEVAGTWGHPGTGVVYTSGLPNIGNSVALTVNTLNINNSYTGQFRILKFFYVYADGSSTNFRCMEEVENFTFDGGPQITNAYSFPCGEGLTEVALEVTGVPPFTYAITSKNNDTTFTVDNEGSNLFSGLEPANYNFQVTDNCGNIRNRDFTITEEPPILITPDGFCEGEYSTLTAPDFTFLSYQWYEEGSPATILSTSAILEFPAFNSASDAGTYKLRLIAENPESCLNQVLTYIIAPNVLPNAGTDAVAELCNPFTNINLTTYLGATFDAGGTWTDDDATGALTGGVFNTAAIGAGTYHFTYTASGLCNSTDTATVTLTLKNMPPAPDAGPNVGVCEGATVQLGSLTVPGVYYSWTGPNGFTSTLQNPTFTNITLAQAGDYYLTVTANGCTSPATMVTVTVSPLPNAGTDGTATVCNAGTIIDLESYLGATHTTGGTWADVDNSGGLTSNNFATTGVAAGTYHFTYSVVNFCNITDVATVTITLNDIPNAPVLATPAPVCEGTDVPLTAPAVANATYAWTGPNGFTSVLQNPTVTAATTAASGTYSLTVTVNGCTSPAGTTSISVTPYPQYIIDGDAVLCEGQTGILSLESANFTPANVTIAWYFEDELQTAATGTSVQVSETGTYRAEVSNGICTTTREFEVAPNTNAFEVVLESGCENEQYMIRVSNIGDILDVASISWTGPAGFNAVGDAANITDGTAGVYTATVTTLNGCSAFADITVDNTHCFIPRGISPGDSDYNNTFDLSNLGVQHLKIFNRYGMQVYEKDNYLNEWYGQSDKGDLPTGTYFYVITLSQGRQVTGWVYLLKRV